MDTTGGANYFSTMGLSPHRWKKNATWIAGYALWVVLALCLGGVVLYYSNSLLLLLSKLIGNFLNFYDAQILRITLVFVTIVLLLWLPVWILKWGRFGPTRLITTIATFAACLFICVWFCTWGWDNYLNGKVYYCTDAVGLDFLRPGDWVHAFGGRPVVVFDAIPGNLSMSDPDGIKRGWSVDKLWLLWLALAGSSVALSGGVAFLVWRRAGRVGGGNCKPPEGPMKTLAH